MNTGARAQVTEDAAKPKDEQQVLYSRFEECEEEVLQEDGTSQLRKHTKVTLILADKDMLAAARKYGHKRPVFMDTTFAINKYKFPFLTCLAPDSTGRGVPLFWAFLPNEQAETFEQALGVFKEAVREKQPDWEPSCFMTDDSDAEQKAVRYVA